jgi:ABC-type branched-subunit amino acid transport system permease subunit
VTGGMTERAASSGPTAGVTRKLAAIGILLAGSAVVYGIAVLKNQWAVLSLIALAVAALIVIDRQPALKRRLGEPIQRERGTLLTTAAILALLAPLPLRGDAYTLHILVMVGVSMILAIGLNFQVGSTGIPNLGFAAFYGVGAYASSLLAIHFQLSFWIAILLAACIAAFFGFLVGLPSLRTRTYHLALVSIAFGLMVYILLNNLGFTGGPNGVKDIPAPFFLGRSLFMSVRIFDLAYPMQLNFYYLVLVFLGATLIAAHCLYHSKVGLFWNAVREDEVAARCSGINVSAAKILAFCVGAFFAGIAGSLYAHYIGYISPENFNMNVSLLLLGMVIMGGMDSILGTCAGAFLLTVAPEKFRALADYRMVATGMIIILMLVFRPTGIIPQPLRDYRKLLTRKRGADAP